MASVRLRVPAGLLLLVTVACGGESGNRGPGPGPGPGPSGPPPVLIQSTGILIGAGDIAVCGSQGTEGTAALLDLLDGTIFTAGDNAYFQGTAAQYQNCYDPTWGRHKGRTRPAPGNHEYETAGARAYFDYFGPSAGPPGVGYYSFEVGPWHVVSMNSNVPAGEGSAQLQWLRDDLARTDARCVAAIWHHPLFSSGQNGPQPMMREVWRVLRDLGADVVISGHDHMYERFGRQDETGRATSSGLRSFVVGTGGAGFHTSFGGPHESAVETRVVDTHGVLELTLAEGGYRWRFVAVDGTVPPGASGSAACH